MRLILVFVIILIAVLIRVRLRVPGGVNSARLGSMSAQWIAEQRSRRT
jgi:hypothetical protein